jgi:hypothetical protein
MLSIADAIIFIIYFRCADDIFITPLRHAYLLPLSSRHYCAIIDYAIIAIDYFADIIICHYSLIFI